MTLDEIFEGFEALWRAADLAGEPQWRGGREASTGICAALIANRASREFSVAAFKEFPEGWRCECGWLTNAHGLWRAIVHLNDPDHSWTWADLMKNYREAYRLGVIRWRHGIAA